MKTLAVGVAAAAIFVQLLSVVALAGGYTSWAPGGPNGTTPHASYSDSTTKCKVCHAVHNAASGGETLLRSTRANSCVYCHLDPGTVSTRRPYGQGAGNLMRYTGENAYNHDNDHNGNYLTYLGCVSCHSVHGANTLGSAQGMAFDGQYILKNDPGLNGGGALTTLTSENDFCRDCHDGSGRNLLFGGCFDNTCHTVGAFASGLGISPTYLTRARNGVTHIMTSTLTGNYGTQVAWTDSNNCWSCHAAGRPYAEGNSFPHYTPSAVQFLPSYTTEHTGLDSACMNCHAEGGNGNNYTTGVGKTF